MSRLGFVWLVYCREVRETLRDRRTLAVMVLFPLVVYPLLSLIAVQVLSHRAAEVSARKSRVAVDAPPDLGREITSVLAGEGGRFEATTKPSTRDDLVAGRLDAVVRWGPRPEGSDVRDGTLIVVHDSTREESRVAADRLETLLANLLPPGCVHRFAISDDDVSTPTQRSGYLASRALPLVLVLMVMLGALYPAIDTTAGERERGTLETTLALPLPRRALLVGKVLAVATLASVTGLANLLSLALTLVQTGRLAGAGAALGPLPWGRLMAAAGLALPSACFFAALMVAIGATARSFKEAQNLLTPLHVLFYAPVLVGTLGELPLSFATAVVPGLGLSLLARDLVVGTTSPILALVVTVATAAYALGAVWIASVLFEPERLLAVTDAERPKKRRPAPGPTHAIAAPGASPVTLADAALLFAVGFLVLVLLAPLQARNVVTGLLVTEWLGLFGLVLVFARSRRIRVRDVLGLHKAPPRAFLGAVLMGSSGWVVAALIAQWVAPAPQEVLEQLKRTFAPEQGGRPYLLNLFVVALTPAICEEALFRGPILRGLSSRLPRGAAILVCGILFSLFHLNLYRLIPTALLGFMLSWLALTTRSIYPGVVAHALNNGILITLATASLDDSLDRIPPFGQVAVMVLAAVLLVGGGSLVWTSRPRP